MRRASGFTLIEAVMVIAITGIVAAAVGFFIRKPVDSYFDSMQRAQLTDAADLAVRRIARDLHLAVPNSVRVSTSGGVTYLEFLQTKTGGYYRKECSITPCPVGEDPLDFTAADASFEVLGGFPAAPAPQPASRDLIVIFNLGVSGADAYNGDNTAAISSITTAASSANITLSAAKKFPFESPSQHFQVIDTPVTYVCNPTAGTLTRIWGYTITASQATPPAGGNSTLLADKVSACTITPPENLPQPGIALVAINLKLKQNNEEVAFYHEVHVNNVP